MTLVSREHLAVPLPSSFCSRKDSLATGFCLNTVCAFISADFSKTWFKDPSSIPLVYICGEPFVKLIRKWAFACREEGVGLIGFEHEMLSNSLHLATGLGTSPEPGPP